MKSSTVQLILIVICSAACQPEPQVLKRYNSIRQMDSADARQKVEITPFITSVPNARNSPSVLLLSERAQAAYVNAASAPGAKPSLLADALFGAQTPVNFVDATSFQRRLVLTVRPVDFNIGDRIEKIEIKLTLPKQVRIISWDKFQNADETINLGTAQLTQSRSLSGTIAATLPYMASPSAGIGSINPSLTAGQSNVLSENRSFTTKFASAYGSLSQDEKQIASLTYVGEYGLDLAGTSNIDFAFRLTSSPTQECSYAKFQNLQSNGKRSKPDEVKLDLIPVNLPFIEEGPVKPDEFSYTAHIRHIMSGADTLSEADDDIVVVVDKGKLKVDDLNFFNVTALGEFIIYDYGKKTRLTLTAPSSQGLSSDQGILTFESRSDAENFMNWLRAEARSGKVDSVAGYRLSIDGLPKGSAKEEFYVTNKTLSSMTIASAASNKDIGSCQERIGSK